ncbi:MAG: biotin synthase BioB, partial [Luteolibacter sp.]
FYGEKLLTGENPTAEADRKLLAKLGLETLEPNPYMAAPKHDQALPASPAAGAPACAVAGCC